MRIVIVGTAHPYRGGLAAFNQRLAQAFAQDGDDVQMVTFTLQYPSFLFPGTSQYTDDAAPVDIEIVRSVNSCNPFSWRATARKIESFSPDVVIFAYWMSFMAPSMGSIASHLRKKGIRCIGLIHNMTPHDRRSIMDRLFPRYFTSKMDGFIALSDSVAREVAIMEPGKSIEVSPHPIYDIYGDIVPRDEALSRLNLSHGGRYVVFFGFIRDYKGLDWLLEAMADERLSSVELIVAGEFYGDSARYFEQERSLGLNGRVHWYNEYIANADICNFFAAADVVVQPYKHATQSGATQIAYHFGTPMIVTNVGGLAEIVPDGEVGYCCEASPKGVADAIVRFYCEGRDFSAGIAEQRRKYSWEMFVKRVKRLF
jgi:glycosyltransferase involved in cell wall biosynthesis